MNSRNWLLGHDIEPNDYLVNALDNLLMEQRKICADDAFNQSQLLGHDIVASEAVSDACLDAE